MIGREGKQRLMIHSIPHHVTNMVERIWVPMELDQCDNVTAGGCSRMNPEEYRAIVSISIMKIVCMKCVQAPFQYFWRGL